MRFYFDNKVDHNEIRSKKDAYVKTLLIQIIFEVIFIVSTFFLNSLMIIFVLLMFLMMLEEYFSFKNNKLIYEEKGITIVTTANKPFFYSWDDVVSVKDTYANPHVFVNPQKDWNKSRVLEIGVRNYKSKIEYHYYFFTEYSGIYDFLKYYECKIKQKYRDR